MTLTLIIFLILIGLLLVLIEIFITPGFIVGLLGIGLMCVGIYKAYTEYGSFTGNVVLAVTAVVAIGTVFFTFRSGAWDRLALNDTITGKVGDPEIKNIKVGATGKTLSALRPSGNALIDGKKVEVVTEGESIDSQTEIEVIQLISNKIIVKQK